MLYNFNVDDLETIRKYFSDLDIYKLKLLILIEDRPDYNIYKHFPSCDLIKTWDFKVRRIQNIIMNIEYLKDNFG